MTKDSEFVLLWCPKLHKLLTEEEGENCVMDGHIHSVSTIHLEDKVLAEGKIGTTDSVPEGLKVVFLVKRNRQYLVEEGTAFSTTQKIFDSEHRKRDAERAYAKALKTPFLILPKFEGLGQSDWSPRWLE